MLHSVKSTVYMQQLSLLLTSTHNSHEVIRAYLWSMRDLSEKRRGPGPAAASSWGKTSFAVLTVADVKMPNLKCSCTTAVLHWPYDHILCASKFVCSSLASQQALCCCT